MTTHAIAPEAFDALARGGGDDGVLRAGQRSKRLLLLHELMATARTRVPQLVAEGGLDHAYTVLIETHRGARHAVDEVLLQPQVGTWATRCLRHLVTRGDVAPGDLGHLGALAAAAALRAGRPFEVVARPRDDGSLMLPTYGLARLPEGGVWCHLRSRPGAGGIEVAVGEVRIEVAFDRPAGSPGEWLPLRRLRSVAGGLVLDVSLDDVDPFRDGDRLRLTGRLSDAAVEGWQAELDGAWSVLVEHHRAQAQDIGTGLVSLVPLRPSGRERVASATYQEAAGAVAMTPSPDPQLMALTLLHERQHGKLFALSDLVPLHLGGGPSTSYAPWRDDPRPVSGLLHGVYAHLAVAAFWQGHRHRGDGSPGGQLAHFEYALASAQVSRALDGLSRSSYLTSWGARLVDGIRRRLSEVTGEAPRVPELAGSLAGTACRDHEASWRLRNLRLDATQVAAWAGAWRAGLPPPGGLPAATVVDGTGPLPSGPRLRLIRRRLAAPDRWRVDPDEAPADVLLVAGRSDAAADAYRARIAEAPEDRTAWAGLCVAHSARRGGAATALTSAPEVVYAVHREVARHGPPPRPEGLAAWIGAGLRAAGRSAGIRASWVR